MRAKPLASCRSHCLTMFTGCAPLLSMRAGSAPVILEGIASSGEAARRAGGTGRCALLARSVAASAARLLVRSEVFALKSAHSGGCVRAVLFRGGAQNSARRTRRAVGFPEESSSPPLEHCTSAGRAVARASLRAKARRVGATTVAAPIRSLLTLVARVHVVVSRIQCTCLCLVR